MVYTRDVFYGLLKNSEKINFYTNLLNLRYGKDNSLELKGREFILSVSDFISQNKKLFEDTYFSDNEKLSDIKNKFAELDNLIYSIYEEREVGLQFLLDDRQYLLNLELLNYGRAEEDVFSDSFMTGKVLENKNV